MQRHAGMGAVGAASWRSAALCAAKCCDGRGGSCIMGAVPLYVQGNSRNFALILDTEVTRWCSVAGAVLCCWNLVENNCRDDCLRGSWVFSCDVPHAWELHLS